MGIDKITHAGLKLTIQRVAILEYLEQTNEHPSAENVYNYIHKIYPTITLSTVYNTLETFAESNIIKKVFTIDGKARYDAKMSKHHHLFDKENGKILDIFDEELNVILNEYISKKSAKFKIDDFQIDFTGKINL